VVVVVHRAQIVEELAHGRRGHVKLVGDDPREVLPVEGRAQVHLRIDEPDALQLHDGVGDLLGPILAA